MLPSEFFCGFFETLHWLHEDTLLNCFLKYSAFFKNMASHPLDFLFRYFIELLKFLQSKWFQCLNMDVKDNVHISLKIKKCHHGYDQINLKNGL